MTIVASVWAADAASPSLPARVCVESAKLVGITEDYAEYRMPSYDMPTGECFFGESTMGRLAVHECEPLLDAAPSDFVGRVGAALCPSLLRREQTRLGLLCQDSLLHGNDTVANCTSDAFMDNAAPEYRFCCGVNQPYDGFTVDLYDKETWRTTSSARVASSLRPARAHTGCRCRSPT